MLSLRIYSFLAQDEYCNPLNLLLMIDTDTSTNTSTPNLTLVST